MNIQLLTRPWSCHTPKIHGYEPVIHGDVTRVSRSRRNCWRAEVFVDGAVLATGHRDTKRAAESWLAGMLAAYTETHYRSK